MVRTSKCSILRGCVTVSGTLVLKGSGNCAFLSLLLKRGEDIETEKKDRSTPWIEND